MNIYVLQVVYWKNWEKLENFRKFSNRFGIFPLFGKFAENFATLVRPQAAFNNIIMFKRGEKLKLLQKFGLLY
jgi:hypothetical protein